MYTIGFNWLYSVLKTLKRINSSKEKLMFDFIMESNVIATNFYAGIHRDPCWNKWYTIDHLTDGFHQSTFKMKDMFDVVNSTKCQAMLIIDATTISFINQLYTNQEIPWTPIESFKIKQPENTWIRPSLLTFTPDFIITLDELRRLNCLILDTINSDEQINIHREILNSWIKSCNFYYDDYNTIDEVVYNFHISFLTIMECVHLKFGGDLINCRVGLSQELYEYFLSFQ